MISGSVRSRAPWWRKNTQREPPSHQDDTNGSGSMGNDQHSDGDSETGQEKSMSNFEAMKNSAPIEDQVVHRASYTDNDR